MQWEFDILGFGEVMMRLSPEGEERIANSETFVKHAGGSELNVVSGIARLGLRSGMITKLPNNPPGRFIRNQIRAYGVSDDYLVTDDADGARVGLYYFEGGGYPRRPQVTYDRAGSSFTTISAGELPEDMFGKARLFHTSGISLGLGETTRDTVFSLVKAFKAQGTRISFDVNYRAKLWGEAEARETILSLLPYVDVLFISEETSRRMMQKTGDLPSIQAAFAAEYGITVVASTQRAVNSPRCHSFSSTLYHAGEGKHYTEPAYENIEVVDRIGSGDAYVSGVLYAWLSGKSPQEMVAYGNATSALKNTIPGDLLSTDRHEIEGIIRLHHDAAGASEMDR